MQTLTDKRSWYREPWVWLLISLPLSAVIGGMITIYLAVSTSDGLVVDDYYQHGKEINRVLARDEAAARYQLQAVLGIDSQGGQVTVTLTARDSLPPSAPVRFLLLHPTRAGQDQEILLVPGGEGMYTGVVSPVEDGSWLVQLGTDEWRLSGRIRLPRTESLVLLPQMDADPLASSPSPD